MKQQSGLLVMILSTSCMRLAGLIELARLTREGWPESSRDLHHDIKPFHIHIDEITVKDKLVMKGTH